MNEKLKYFVISSVIIMCIVALISCKSSERQKISVAIGKNIWCSLTIIAEENGFFDEAGIDVNIFFQDAGKYCMDALIANQVEFANVVEVNVAYLGYTGNQDIKVIGSVVESTSCGIVTPKSKNIKTPQDLIGKSLAFSPGTGGELFAYRFLENNEISREQVIIRKLQPKAIAPAIVSGDIDAASSWEPYIYGAVKGLKGEAVVFRDPEAYTGYMFLAVKKKWANDNKLAVNAFLEGLIKATEFVNNNVEESKNLLAEKLRVELDLVETIWPHFNIELSYNKEKMLNATTQVGVLVRETESSLGNKPIPDYSLYFVTSYFDQLTKRNY